MKIILKPHLKLRLGERKIPEDYPEKTISKADGLYFDNYTSHLIAVKDLLYAGKLRPMVVAYDIIGQEIQIVTIYPTSNQVIQNRLSRKRWVKR